MTGDRSGLVVGTEELGFRASPDALHCVFEQSILSSAYMRGSRLRNEQYQINDMTADIGSTNETACAFK